MCAAFGFGNVAAVIYGEKDMCRAGEVGESFAERERVRCLKDHKGHARPEEDNIRSTILYKEFPFQISVEPVNVVAQMTIRNLLLPEGYYLQYD